MATDTRSILMGRLEMETDILAVFLSFLHCKDQCALSACSHTWLRNVKVYSRKASYVMTTIGTTLPQFAPHRLESLSLYDIRNEEQIRCMVEPHAGRLQSLVLRNYYRQLTFSSAMVRELSNDSKPSCRFLSCVACFCAGLFAASTPDAPANHPDCPMPRVLGAHHRIAQDQNVSGTRPLDHHATAVAEAP